MSTVRALTIHQPWATLIAQGYKRTETRARDTKVRGTVAIHASRAMPCRLGERVRLGEFEVERDKAGLLLRADRLGWPYRLPLGAVVALADLFQVRSTTNPAHCPSDEELALGDHSPGRWAWYLTSVCPITPVLAVGHQSWWTWEVPDRAAGELRYPLLEGARG